MIFGRLTVDGSRGLALTVLTMLALFAGLNGCRPANPPSGNTAAGTGTTAGTTPAENTVATTINVEGSSTVFLISQAVANEFEKISKHKVSVGRSGTGGGYKKFVLRQSDIWNASRPIDDKEKAELKEKGIEWLELEVAIDGLSVAVHPKNDWCTELTIGQLRKMWTPESTVQKWNDVDSKWPDKKIAFFGADTDSGTFEYFTEVVVGKKKTSRTDYTAASDDNVLIQGVANDENALAYIPFGYCVENKDVVKVIKISPSLEADNPAPAVEPTVETILSGEYQPLARPLFIYVNMEALKRSEIVEFVKFHISEASQPLVAKRGFVRMPEEKRLEMIKRLDAALKPTDGGSTDAASAK
ncbi:MAG: PstS family phosphate ABC transporter substrate-binding protein [Planctomycetes bacterium]|nr:PstS family phosphate ABC transporter substrate-binding protein [Planctomycetota bacterium]